MRVASSFSAPRDRYGATVKTLLLAERLVQAQEHDAALVLGLEADEQHGGRLLELGERHADAGPCHVRAEEGLLLVGRHARAGVDVVGAEHDARELLVRVRVLHRDAAAWKHADALGLLVGDGARLACGGLEACGRGLERLGPRHLDELAVLADERPGQAVGLVLPREGEAVLVGDPVLVHHGVVVGEPAQDLAATVVGADRASRGVVLGDAGARHEVERARAEAVRGARERADGADLDGVARVVRAEGVARLVLGGGADGAVAVKARARPR